MKTEFQNIINAYRKIDLSRNKAALATILQVKGSSYRRPGARMLIADDGNWTGAISGGCLERDALRKALAVIESDKARIVTYDTSDEDENAFGIGLGCNGIIDVLMEPLHPGEKGNPLELLELLLTQNEQAIMATVFGPVTITGQRAIYKSDSSLVSTIQDKELQDFVDRAIRALEPDSKSLVIEAGSERPILVEVLRPDIQLLIFGTGYDAIPLVKIAKLTGCHVSVIHETPHHLNSSRFTEADERIMARPEELLKKLRITKYNAAVLISHNFNYDLAVIQELLKTDLPYIGLLGPHKKLSKLMESSVNIGAKDLQRIYNPVGLDIGAETPEEIALSIMAEIKAVFSGRPGQMLKLKNGPIHE